LAIRSGRSAPIIFNAERFAPGDAKLQWTAIDLEGGEGVRVLDPH
jgi:hypothetical protein